MTSEVIEIRFRPVVVTSTRADWGLLRPLARLLSDTPGVALTVVATNMHLDARYGHTVDEIVADGFENIVRVPMPQCGESEADKVRAMAACTAGMAEVFGQLRPDAVILLGDRYEILGVASAAAVMDIPVVHIAGGEVSLGAVDDALRHAITKLSTLHLTATEDYRRRVIQMGEDPRRVVNTGAIGVWNALNVPLMGRAELSASLEFDLPEDRDLAVVTYHPATRDASESPRRKMEHLLEALDDFARMRVIITYPNNDAHSGGIIRALEEYVSRHPDRVLGIPSLGMRRYLSAITLANAVIGNSSSGIVEAPSAGTPTVDIGIRQRGRTAAPSVLHCGDTAPEISAAISRALSPEMQALASRRENPYFRPDTPRLQYEAVMHFLESLPAGPKEFYDI